MEQLKMPVGDTDQFLSANGYNIGNMPPKMEAKFGQMVLMLAVDEGRDSAIAFSKGRAIPLNQLPDNKPSGDVNRVPTSQLLLLTSLLEGPKTRRELVNEVGMGANTVGSCLQQFMKVKRVSVHSRRKRHGASGSPVYVYEITGAGVAAVMGTEWQHLSTPPDWTNPRDDLS